MQAGEIQGRRAVGGGGGQTVDISEVLLNSWLAVQRDPGPPIPQMGGTRSWSWASQWTAKLESIHDGCVLLHGRTNVNCRSAFKDKETQAKPSRCPRKFAPAFQCVGTLQTRCCLLILALHFRRVYSSQTSASHLRLSAPSPARRILVSLLRAACERRESQGRLRNGWSGFNSQPSIFRVALVSKRSTNFKVVEGAWTISRPDHIEAVSLNEWESLLAV
jgi:hypothetical protein